jgi:hypothetical protein
MSSLFSESRERLRKLRTMSPAEIASRAGYKLQTTWERSRTARQRTNLERLASAVTAGGGSGVRLQTLLAGRRVKQAAFFAGAGNRQEMQELFRTCYAGGLEISRRKAEDVRHHVIEFFGQRFRCGTDIDWHADPESGRQWPRVYHADVPIHDSSDRFGDVKYVWELNRQQFLLDLGKVSFLDGSPAHARAAVAIVRSWIAHNPTGIGVNWACALEPAFRIFSWLWTYQLCWDSLQSDDESHLEWLAGFHEHGQFLYRHLELYSSPYNHLIGEAAALYALGVMFPEFHGARAWRSCGRHILETRLDKQFYRDGGSLEQSTFYHHATLGFYLFAVLLGRANNEEFARPVWQAIERAIEFSAHLIQPDGCTPPIGGADDGKPIRLEHRPLWDFRAFQAVGAVLFDRPDMKHIAGEFPEDALWLLGPDGRRRFDSLDAAPPRDTFIALPDSGYFVARTSWARDADYMCFDCGEQADSVRRDDIPNAVHGHADCLSATVWLGGRPVLIDPGVYRYNGDPSWVAHFRGTGAHSTLLVDRRDQARYRGKMAWSNAFLPRVERWWADSGQAFVIGSHDGYARQPGGVIHRRIVWLRPEHYVIIWDEVSGEGNHDLDLRYQFAPGRAELLSAHTLSFDGLAECGWVASVPTTSDLRTGGSQPNEGWIARSLGVRQPAPALAVRAAFQAPRTVFMTVVADSRAVGAASRIALMTNRDVGLAVAVRNADSVDWIVSGDVAPDLPFQTDAKLAIWKLRDRRVVDMCTVGDGEVYPATGDLLVEPASSAIEAIMAESWHCV